MLMEGWLVVVMVVVVGLTANIVAHFLQGAVLHDCGCRSGGRLR